MPGIWTSDYILSLAPDASAAKAGQSLANPRKWETLGATADVAWGTCQGSAAAPYQTQASLSEAAYRCTCPSRKLPCKHTLGLLLLLDRQPPAFAETTPPDWVTSWLAGRAKRSEQRAQKQTRSGDVADMQAQARRAADRAAKVAAGLAELDRWLGDLVRRGLAEVQGQPYRFWDGPAARLVDAQAPGLARRVRELAGAPASGAGWPERLLARLGLLHLAVRGYQQMAALPPATQADLRTVIGWTQSQDGLAGEPAVRDHWAVVGRYVGEDEQMRVQRTWLWGQATGRPALALQFAPRNQPLDAGWVPGSVLDADLVFYPSAYPLRAIVSTTHAPPVSLDSLPGYPTVAAGIAAYADALAQQPWLAEFPLALAAVVPVPHGDGWAVRDAVGAWLPLHPRFEGGWTLRAVSGGHPLALFGEWDGDYLLPLGAWDGDSFLSL